MTPETEYALLENNFKLHLKDDKKDKEEMKETLHKILTQVEYTNGRVKKIEQDRGIKKAIQEYQQKVITVLASLGFLGGVGSHFPKLLSLFS